jgi:hypothetical protein
MLRRATFLILLALFVHVFGFADDCDGRGVRRHFTIQSIPEQHVEAGYLWNYAGDVSVCGQCGWATNVPTAPTELSMNWGDGTSTPLSINMAGGQPHTTKASHTYDKPSGDPGVSFKPYAKAKAYCVAGWGQFWESIASNGEFFSESTAGRATGYDFASTPEVHVYPADKPTGIVVSATISEKCSNKRGSNHGTGETSAAFRNSTKDRKLCSTTKDSPEGWNQRRRFSDACWRFKCSL